MYFRALKLLILWSFFSMPQEVWPATVHPLLTDYTHTAWTELSGAPTGVTKFAQGADGWLWMSTPTGLYRFDGVRFERTDKVYGYPLQSSNIRTLAIAPDGAVWVGYRLGGVSVFRKNGSHTYMEADGLHAVGVTHIEVAPDGSVWVGMRDGLAVLAAHTDRFEYMGSEVGLPSLGVFQVMFARDGTTWIGTNSGAYYRRPGERRFEHAWPRKVLTFLCEAPDGTIWGNDLAHGYYRISTTATSDGQAVRPELKGERMYIDRQGTMWMMHADRLERKPRPFEIDLPNQDLSTLNGISGEMPFTALQDREGNLWFGTVRGIDRLRRNRLRTVPTEVHLDNPALVVGLSGDMWVGDSAGDLWSYDQDGRVKRQSSGLVTASYTAPDGVLWLGGAEGVQRRERDGRLIPIPSPNGVKAMRVHALQQDREGELWASFNTGTGVYKLVRDQWVKSGGLKGIPEVLTTSMTLDGAGRLWMGHLHSQVTVVSGNTVRTLGPDQGLQLGTVLQVYFDGQAIWAGGEDGVALYRQGRFDVLQGERNERFRGVSGIARIPNGDLWLHGAEGLYRIPAAGLGAWMKGKHDAVPFERFDAHDGMQGHASQFRPVPSLRYASDGMLWFATTASIGNINPTQILRNPLAPPVEILGVVADGAGFAVRDTNSLELPKGTRNLQIDFTALSLSIPERMRLRYRLVGFDGGWQEPIERRQAYFTNLGPGKYRFEVIASNEDNVWNTKGASLELNVPPTFVQSVWYKLILMILGCLLLYVAYAVRIRYLKQLMNERLTERERIARALHDTLIQSIQGLILRFHSVGSRLPKGNETRQAIASILDQADALMAQGRSELTGLRAETEDDDVSIGLRTFGESLQRDIGPRFSLGVEGDAREITAEARTAIFYIAREALFNAYRHASPTHVEARLDYGLVMFSLTVRDDGLGVPENIVRSGGKEGHWGIVGMRERAVALNGSVEIQRCNPTGTQVTLTLPSAQVYRRRFPFNPLRMLIALLRRKSR
jgi:signal transduction histidine kinase/ligand-binding sensor domain-containing protein